jgi:hypothetical protein
MLRRFSTQELADLHQKLSAYFDDGELKTLCFDLDVTYDDLPGDGKASKARELVAFMGRRDRIPELVAECEKQRPNVEWNLSSNGNVVAASNGSRAHTVRDAAGSIQLPDHVAGDVIIAQIGAGAENVAVGKNVAQRIGTLDGPDDKQVVGQKLAEVTAAFDKVRGQVDATVVAVADFQLGLLRGELQKTARGEVPSANVITQVSGWLLDNVPQMKPALANLFVAPAVSRVVTRAGSSAVEWVKAKFGQ